MTMTNVLTRRRCWRKSRTQGPETAGGTQQGMIGQPEHNAKDPEPDRQRAEIAPGAGAGRNPLRHRVPALLTLTCAALLASLLARPFWLPR